VAGGESSNCEIILLLIVGVCSRVYVDHILSSLPLDRLHLNSSVQAISTSVYASTSPTTGGAVRIQIANGETKDFDHVILACHADTALSILHRGHGLRADEAEILGAFKFSRNEVVLHSDLRVRI
jgi:predicted NAD/FAD-binding protein